MPILDPIRFDGTLSNGDISTPVNFTAGMNDDGILTLELAPIIPARRATPFIPRDMPLQTQSSLSLYGQSEDGWRFVSDQTHVTRWHHPEGQVEIGLDCSLAEFSRDAAPDHADMRAWFFRKLATIHGVERQTPLGRLVFRGYTEGADQQPVSVLAIHAPDQRDEEWWSESERFLIHLERVLSFACDVYLVPIYEQRVRSGVMTLRVVPRGRTPNPYMQPFDLLHMWPVFDCAIRSFTERAEAVEQLDPAIRWITATVAYQELRLINAMSALESILATCEVPDLFEPDLKRFADLKKKVRRLLKDEKIRGGMGGKVDELNRRSFRQKLEDLIALRDIPTSDFPDGWLSAIITARNTIVHTGVAPDMPSPDGRLIDHIVWAREIVTRLILEAIRFDGQFQSWLHRSEYLSFPGCRPMTELAAAQEVAVAAAAEPTLDR